MRPLGGSWGASWGRGSRFLFAIFGPPKWQEALALRESPIGPKWPAREAEEGLRTQHSKPSIFFDILIENA